MIHRVAVLVLCVLLSHTGALAESSQQQSMQPPNLLVTSPVALQHTVAVSNLPAVQAAMAQAQTAPTFTNPVLPAAQLLQQPFSAGAAAAAASPFLPSTEQPRWDGMVTAAAPLEGSATYASTNPILPQRFGPFPVTSLPVTRIVGEDACGCPPGQVPCFNPCKKRRTVTDELKARLSNIKSRIVQDAQRIQKQNLWIRQVRNVIQHYESRIRDAEARSNQVKDHIRDLFAKKQHYEDLLIQHQRDKEATGSDQVAKVGPGSLEREIAEIKAVARTTNANPTYVFK